MAKKSAGKGAFPKWATPMTAPKIHGNDPMVSPDNAIAYPKVPNPMGFPIAGKTKGYNIGTGGVKDKDRIYKNGR